MVDRRSGSRQTTERAWLSTGEAGALLAYGNDSCIFDPFGSPVPRKGGCQPASATLGLHAPPVAITLPCFLGLKSSAAPPSGGLAGESRLDGARRPRHAATAARSPVNASSRSSGLGL